MSDPLAPARGTLASLPRKSGHREILLFAKAIVTLRAETSDRNFGEFR